MKSITSIIAGTALIFAIATTATASDTILHHQKHRHVTYYKGDPLGRNHWTYGRRARMQKQILQAQYHEKQVDRAEAAQQKVAKETSRKRIN